MLLIEDFNELNNLGTNKIYVENKYSSLTDSQIVINGENNIIYIEDGVKICNSCITFTGNNSVLFLSKSNHKYILNLSINNNSCVYFGKNSYFNGQLHIITSEGQSVLIGSNCLFSFNVWIRTADPHLIYSIETKERINHSKSVYIGDHIWIGQGSFILKGSYIGSGSIIGGGAVVSGKKIESNSIYAGNPAKKIKSGVFFDEKCVHQWTPETTEKYKINDLDDYIYNCDESTMNLSEIDTKLKANISSEEKLNYIKENLSKNSNKNRFSVVVPIKNKGIRAILDKYGII